QLTVKGFSLGPNQDANHFIKVGGVKITNYDSWKFIPGGSAILAKFKIPEAVNTNYWFSETVQVAAYNHGVESNKRPLEVNP
ncbi:MAG: hypothetical protein AAF317_10835, partial [Pseudomonadota bacterium]